MQANSGGGIDTNHRCTFTFNVPSQLLYSVLFTDTEVNNITNWNHDINIIS